MPLSPEQKLLINSHLRSNTLFSSAGDAIDRMSFVNRIERVIDYGHHQHNGINDNYQPHTTNNDNRKKTVITEDLFLPNCFIINQDDTSTFWLKIASIITKTKRLCHIRDWHAIEYGCALNRVDRKERYIYTWSFKGDTYRFYTKILTDGYHKELIWYMGRSLSNCLDSNHEECDDSSSCGSNTDSEELDLHGL